jgi:hypothetical protein
MFKIEHKLLEIGNEDNQRTRFLNSKAKRRYDTEKN